MNYLMPNFYNIIFIIFIIYFYISSSVIGTDVVWVVFDLIWK